MKELAIVLRPDEPTLVYGPVDQSIENLQQIVGGPVEQVRISEGITLLVNEEPWTHDSRINFPATLLAAQYGKPIPHGLRGVVVVLGKPYAKGWRAVTNGAFDSAVAILRQGGILDDLPQR